MSTLICLPAHILEAAITPRAREVLMLLASQTSMESPRLWVCQKTLAERLRCSPATVGRAIVQLVRQKMIAETGELHQGRYKFYHVRWSNDENMKAVAKKITKPVRKTVIASTAKQSNILQVKAEPGLPTASGARRRDDELPPAPQAPTIPAALMKNSRIAHFAEIARKQHQENLRLHQAFLKNSGDYSFARG